MIPVVTASYTVKMTKYPKYLCIAANLNILIVAHSNFMYLFRTSVKTPPKHRSIHKTMNRVPSLLCQFVKIKLHPNHFKIIRVPASVKISDNIPTTVWIACRHFQ